MPKFLKSSFFLITLIIFSLNVTVIQVKASVALLEDQFDNLDPSGTPIGWTEIMNPDAWSVIDGKYIGSVPSESTEAETLTGNVSWDDYSFEVDVTGKSGPDRTILFRYDESRSTRKGYAIKYVEDNFYDANIALLGTGGLCQWRNFDINSKLDETHRIKVEGKGNNIKVYFDEGLVIDCNDDTPILSGQIGFYVQISGAIDPLTGWWATNTTAYDNVLVKTINSQENLFDLPFNYNGRPDASSQQFKSTFWKRLTATFDHVLKTTTFRPFTGNSYKLRDCLSGTAGISCYDSHNGTDFSKKGGKDVLSVSEGTVVFTSEHTRRNCTPNRGGFGCVVIVEYPDNIFGLYAHLNKISVNEGDSVNVNTVLGVMGNTGCPNCGVHLHFGVLNPVGLPTSLEMKKGYIASRMSKNDWKEIIYQARPEQTPIPRYRPYCTYKAPNGQRFSFQDPSGWNGNDTDPWSKPTSEGGCGIESPYLWKFDVGTSP